MDKFLFHCSNNKEFPKIAEELMNNYAIVNGNEKFEITEIEFYLHCKGHEDPFSHQSEMQLEYSKVYRHSSGIDLTLGNEEYGIKCGVLIRAIRSKEGYTYGPIVLRRQIDPNNTIFENGAEFPIGKIEIGNDINFSTNILSGPRFGLSLREISDEKKDYIFRNYRFYKYPKNKHGDKTLLVFAELLKRFELIKNKNLCDIFQNEAKESFIEYSRDIFGSNFISSIVRTLNLNTVSREMLIDYYSDFSSEDRLSLEEKFRLYLGWKFSQP